MGDEREFKIRMTVDAASAVAGSQQTAVGLQGVTSATTKGAEATEVAAKAAEKSEISHRNLRFGLSMLGSQAAELGHLLIASFANPATAAFLAVTAALAAMTEWSKKARVAFEEAASGKAAEWKAQADRVAELAEATAKFNERLVDATKNTGALKEKEAEELEILNLIIEARKKMAGDDQVRVGELDAAARKQRIDILEDTLNQMWGERMTAGSAMGAANAAMGRGTGDEGQAAIAGEWLRIHADDVKNAQADLDAGRAAGISGKAGEFLRSASGAIGVPGGVIEGLSPQEKEKALAAYMDVLAKKLEDAKSQQASAMAVIEANKLATDGLKTAQEKAVAEVERLEKAIQEQTAAVEKAKNLDRVKTGLEYGAELDKYGYKPESRLGQTLMGVITSEEAVEHGDRMTAAQAGTAKELMDSLKLQGMNQEQIEALFKEMKDLHIDHATKLKDIFTDLRQIKQQLRSAHTQ